MKSFPHSKINNSVLFNRISFASLWIYGILFVSLVMKPDVVFCGISPSKQPNIIFIKFMPDVSPSDKEQIISSVGKTYHRMSWNDYGDWIQIWIKKGTNIDEVVKKLKSNPAVCHAMSESAGFSPFLAKGDVQVRLKPNISQVDKKRIISIIGDEKVIKDWPKNYLLLKISNKMTIDEAIQKLKADSAVLEANLPHDYGPGKIWVKFKMNISSSERERAIIKVGSFKFIPRPWDLKIDEKLKSLPPEQRSKIKNDGNVEAKKDFNPNRYLFPVNLKYGISVEEALEMLKNEPAVDHAKHEEFGEWH